MSECLVTNVVVNLPVRHWVECDTDTYDGKVASVNCHNQNDRIRLWHSMPRKKKGK